MSTSRLRQQPALRALFEQLDRPVRSARPEQSSAAQPRGIRLLRTSRYRYATAVISWLTYSRARSGKYPVIMRMGVYGKAFGLGSIYEPMTRGG